MTTMAKWREGSHPDEVANRLEAAKDGSVAGKAAFFGFEHSELVIVLGGMIEFAAAIPELERRKILNKATFEAGGKGKITPTLLLQSCHKQETEYLRRPLTAFRLLTGVSLASVHNLPSIRIGSSAITFNPKAQVARQHRAKLYSDAKFSLGFDLPTQYMDVSVTVKARSPFEGAQRALDAIDLARATWNLALNRGKDWRISSGRPRPVNDILLGPFHTMHNEDGSLATESWWYDPGYSGPAQPFMDRAKIDRLFTFSKKLRTRLSQSAYPDELANSLVRYVRALDAADLNDAFLRLWSILEFLTDSTFNPYKVAVRRAAFMFAERDYSVQVLTHLMNHRNRFVHAGTDTAEIESLVYLLKRYVDALLMFHIGNLFKFKSRASAALFMDLPPSKSQIDQRIRRLRNAHKFVTAP
jgi:hypothetical protein